jgi:hypothetical protein
MKGLIEQERFKADLAFCTASLYLVGTHGHDKRKGLPMDVMRLTSLDMQDNKVA